MKLEKSRDSRRLTRLDRQGRVTNGDVHVRVKRVMETNAYKFRKKINRD